MFFHFSLAFSEIRYDIPNAYFKAFELITQLRKIRDGYKSVMGIFYLTLDYRKIDRETIISI